MIKSKRTWNKMSPKIERDEKMIRRLRRDLLDEDAVVKSDGNLWPKRDSGKKSGVRDHYGL